MVFLVGAKPRETTLPDNVGGNYAKFREEAAIANGTEPVTENKVSNYTLGNYTEVLEHMASANDTQPVTEDEVGNYVKLRNYMKVLEQVASANGTQPVREEKVDNYVKLGNYMNVLEQMASANGTQPVREDKVDNYIKLGNYVKVLEQMASARGTQPMRDTVPTVRILKFFSNEVDFNMFLHEMARLYHASIMRTNKEVFGKRVRKYKTQYVLPRGAVVVTCHPQKNCTSACDDRFADDSNFVSVPPSQPRPSLRGSRPASDTDLPSSGTSWGFCHSPPTTSQMVYTQAEFEDDSVEWLMWACHVEHLTHRMCHPIDVVVVDSAFVQAAVRHAA
jgi:hypothetical protein